MSFVVPESETPETDALLLEYKDVPFEDEWKCVFAVYDHARSLERRLSLAQAEIKWLTVQTTRLGKDLVCAQENFHVTNQAYVKADVERTQAQARIAELEKLLREVYGEFAKRHILATDLQTRIDAALKDRA